MEETYREKVSNIEYYVVLKEFEDVFKQIPGLPPKIDIYFSINMIPQVTPLSNTPWMRTT